ncbi:hypothetical protein TIFTF001_053541, partial [Ficus carica]
MGRLPEMGTLGQPRHWPRLVYALAFCLVATSAIADYKPYVYESPPPPEHVVDKPYLYNSPPPKHKDHPPKHHKPSPPEHEDHPPKHHKP